MNNFSVHKVPYPNNFNELNQNIILTIAILLIRLSGYYVPGLA